VCDFLLWLLTAREGKLICYIAVWISPTCKSILTLYRPDVLFIVHVQDSAFTTPPVASPPLVIYK